MRKVDKKVTTTIEDIMEFKLYPQVRESVNIDVNLYVRHGLRDTEIGGIDDIATATAEGLWKR
jgi:hypothetical protein